MQSHITLHLKARVHSGVAFEAPVSSLPLLQDLFATIRDKLPVCHTSPCKSTEHACIMCHADNSRQGAVDVDQRLMASHISPGPKKPGLWVQFSEGQTVILEST